MIKKMLAALFARNKTVQSAQFDSVTVGSAQIAVYPVGVEDAIRLTLFIAPYVATFQKYSGSIATAVAQDHKRRDEPPSTLRAIVQIMTKDLEGLPGDILQIVSIFLRRDVDWIAENATAQQIVAALPVIDKANDIAALIRCTGLLGFVPGAPSEDPVG